jgi:hypothetical protein
MGKAEIEDVRNLGIDPYRHSYNPAELVIGVCSYLSRWWAILFGLARFGRQESIRRRDYRNRPWFLSRRARAGYLRNLLLISEVALSPIMLVSADLLVETQRQG